MKRLRRLSPRDNPTNSSASRWSGFSMPRTDTEHKKSIGIDNIQDLDNAPIMFEYGKDLLPDWALKGCPPFMRRFHNWYKWTCRLGLKSIYAPHHLDVFGVKGPQIFDIIFDFADIQHICSTSKNLVLKWFDSGACKCLIILIYFILRHKVL